MSDQISGMDRQFGEDVQVLLKHLTLKSDLANTIERIRKYDIEVTGADMHNF
jgi:hypothetical protein